MQANPVADWTESILALPDNQFFDIIRLYLGDVKTPYNKQRLIEQLAGFLRNEENAANIISLIDQTDFKILTAIYYINNPTEELLSEFFVSDFSMAEVYALLSNLSSRLIIYSEEQKYTGKKSFKINPLLMDSLKDKLSINRILLQETCVRLSSEDTFTISPDFLFCLISYIKHIGITCKADGELKKNEVNHLNTIFPNKIRCIQLILNAFVNLKLLVEGNKGFEIDIERCKLFASLPLKQQTTFICAASCSYLSRDGLKREAQLFLDCISSIPPEGYSRSTIVKLAFLISNSSAASEAPERGRFSKIMEAARNEVSVNALQNQAGNIIDRMIDSAIEFGLLIKKGFNENNEAIYVAAEQIDYSLQNGVPKVLNIDGGFTITLMPGLSLKQLLFFTDFFVIKQNGIVSVFEITRQSVSKAFDSKFTPEQITEGLKQYVPYELPQNLIVSIADWYNSYNSARLYQGYVLKVTENNINYVENNPKIKPYIKEKLSEGIYLLNIPVNSDISYFIAESGLDFMGTVKDSSPSVEKIAFPQLGPAKVLAVASENLPEVNYAGAGELLKKLKAELNEMELTQNQKESLSNKIHQRLIVSEKQLKTTSIRTEILEADGMDFSGKIHLITSAIENDDRMEFTLPQLGKENEYFAIVGKPLSLSRQTADAIVRFQIEPSNSIDNFVVSRITHIKRLRF